MLLRWDEISRGSPTRKCPRDPEVQLLYNRHFREKNEIYRDWYGKSDVPGIETYLNIKTADIFEPVAVFEKNKFPYLLEPDIRHYVAWVSRPNISLSDVLILAQSRFFDSEIVAWENRQDNRSIYGLKHFQVFVRRKI